jgi:hypothetical protein
VTPWSIFWKAVKAFLGWLFFTVVFIIVASFTTGFKAYCPITSFIYGSIAVFILILVLGWAMGVYED